MSNLQTKTEKTNLERFYQGWPHFQSMSAGENFIVFKVAQTSHVGSSMKYARERINRMSLPLEVLGTGANTKTFIVKEIAA